MTIPQLIDRLNSLGIAVLLEKNEIATTSARAIPRSIALTIGTREQELKRYLKEQQKEQKPEKTEKTEQTPKVGAKEAIPKTTRQGKDLTPRPDTIPRLPFDLERLISAASNERLELNLAGVHDPNRYVMGWACAYLTGDRHHALQMLRQAQQTRVTN